MGLGGGTSRGGSVSSPLLPRDDETSETPKKALPEHAVTPMDIQPRAP